MSNTATAQTKKTKATKKVAFLVSADGKKALPGASDWFAEYIERLNRERA